MFLALVLLGAGIVALRDTAVALQWLHGTPWIDAVIDRIDGMSFAWWVSPAGVAALAVGAVLVISAVRPFPQDRISRESDVLGVDFTVESWPG